ncbi:MAG TPA: hypothetical protein VMQ11_00865 [Alphaproteobacteria bacterium]|nr:hypothetical protein [Alphaproteobacteria bacterium]
MGSAATPAKADHGHSHVFLGFNFGVPAYPAYYPPPPVYYPPPPVYYAPPPVVVYSPPAPVYAAPAPAPAAPNCRTYNGDATIDASGKPFYGTACQGSDGRWHIQ